MPYQLLLAQDDPPPSDGVLDILLSGGATGVLILLVLLALSLLAVALVVEHLITLRLSVLAPDGLADRVAKQLSDANLQGAAGACDQQPSALASILRPALGEVEGGWPAMEKTLEDATADQSARLFRKIEYLSVIGNIAPMVGLLGTVVGMIFAFQEVANTQGAARAAQLASGIYQALVTTVGGLLVAIPSLAAYAVFRNRVEGLISQVAGEATRATQPLKRLLIRGATKPVQASGPPEGGRRKAENRDS
ncbi:MAG: MotA/TolQ/ExbB proton channel family protein [Planctomycetota bacterium]